MFKLSKISLMYVEIYSYVNSFIIICSSSKCFCDSKVRCVVFALRKKGSDGFRVATQDNPGPMILQKKGSSSPRPGPRHPGN